MKMNLTMLTDFYEFTMSQGYFEAGFSEQDVVFDMYFRKVPDDGGYAVMAGVSQLIDYIKQLHFDDQDIAYLRSLDMFHEPFLDYLKQFNFRCDIYAVKEGTPIFPNEPIVVVCGPAMQAQFVETMILLTINHQTLIATKASRITQSAKGAPVVEFGARRAQSYDAAIYGARAAYIGGVAGTSCTIAHQHFGVPIYGTMAHAWVQMFDSEYESFKAYASLYPSKTVLLIDTYNVLKSGLPNAIKVAKEVLHPLGHRLKAVRLDSGDIAYLSKEVRRILDLEGLNDCQIMASNSLDEFLIQQLQIQGAKVDIYGVGERLITSKSEPVFGGVYKLVAVKKDNTFVSKIKISENVEKITTPGFKMLYRLMSKKTGKMLGDVLTLVDETIDDSKPYLLFHPVYTWKQKWVDDFEVVPLLEPIFKNGKLVYDEPTIDQIKTYADNQKQTLWDETLRLANPQSYYVDFSLKLWEEKQRLLKIHG